MDAKPTIAIVMGDPAGIGPEIIVKLLSEENWHKRCRLFIIGDAQVMRDSAAALNASLRIRAIDKLAQATFDPGRIDLLSPPGFDLGPVPPPEVNAKSGEAAGRYLQYAYELAAQALVQGVVMAPMNKESFRLAGYNYYDELEFLGAITDSPEPFILGAAGAIWAVAVTEHIAFRDIASHIKRARILTLYRTYAACLGQGWDWTEPRIAGGSIKSARGRRRLVRPRRDRRDRAGRSRRLAR